MEGSMVVPSKKQISKEVEDYQGLLERLNTVNDEIEKSLGTISNPRINTIDSEKETLEGYVPLASILHVNNSRLRRIIVQLESISGRLEL
jgi:hypothetical protein